MEQVKIKLVNKKIFFSELYSNPAFEDTTILCGTIEIKCSKVVLASQSPYFRGLFEKIGITQNSIIVFAEIEAHTYYGSFDSSILFY